MTSRKSLGFLAGLSVFLFLAAPGRADFTLTGTEQTTVNTPMNGSSNGYLYDQSQATIASGVGLPPGPGGVVESLTAYDYSTANVNGGSVQNGINAYNNSTVNLSATGYGGVNGINAYNNSTVNYSGGNVSGGIKAYNNSIVNFTGGDYYAGPPFIAAYDNSTVNITGGLFGGVLGCGDASVYINGGKSVNNSLVAQINSTIYLADGTVGNVSSWSQGTIIISGGNIIGNIEACDSSSIFITGGNGAGSVLDEEGGSIIFQASSYLLGTGLSLNGDYLIGEGSITGFSPDGTSWTYDDVRGGNVLLEEVPEPESLSLMLFGLLFVIRSRRK